MTMWHISCSTVLSEYFGCLYVFVHVESCQTCWICRESSWQNMKWATAGEHSNNSRNALCFFVASVSLNSPCSHSCHSGFIYTPYTLIVWQLSPGQQRVHYCIYINKVEILSLWNMLCGQNNCGHIYFKSLYWNFVVCISGFYQPTFNNLISILNSSSCLLCIWKLLFCYML